MDKDFLIEAFQSMAGADVRLEEGDYIKDGLLYCGKCDTPKEMEATFLDKLIKVKCLCRCGAEEHRKQEQKRAEWEHVQKVYDLKKRCFAGAQGMQNWTFENDDRQNQRISDVAIRYVHNFETMKTRGKGLLLYGPVDTGKTYISACIANALLEREVSCYMVQLSRLVNTLQDIRNKQDYLDDINFCKLLVIDDFASERNTEYMNELVYNIIDARYRSGRPLIVTTNLTAEELKNPQDLARQRIYSRLLEMCIPVEVSGVHRRKEKLKRDFADLKDLLGI